MCARKPEPDTKPQWKKVDQNLLGEGQFFGTNVAARKPPNPSFAIPSRPGTSQSMRSKSPYDVATHDFAARSMFDLSQVSHRRQTSFSSLKLHNSEANLRTNFANGSSPNLALPLGFSARPGTPSRPGTSHGQRSKPWVNPIDVIHGKKVVAGPKSPLGLAEPHSAIGDSSLLGNNPEEVAQAIINQVNSATKSSTTPPSAALLSELDAKSPTRGPYPSPPQSVKGVDRGYSHNRREPPNGVNGPAALPSPPMNQTLLGEDKSPWDSPPIIKNVAARKDSFTVDNDSTRRQSLSMKIEEFEKTLVKEQEISRQANEGRMAQNPHPAVAGGRNMKPSRPQQAGGMATEPRWPMDDWGPPAPDAQGRARPQSPARPRGPMMDGPRPQSPAGMRGPRNQSPRRQGPPNQGPMGRGPRPESPMGRRPFDAPPRGQSPMGRPQRPHSPAGMRGPRQESPMGRRPFDGPPGQQPPGMRALGPEGPMRLRGQSPMGRRPFDAPHRPGPGPFDVSPRPGPGPFEGPQRPGPGLFEGSQRPGPGPFEGPQRPGPGLMRSAGPAPLGLPMRSPPPTDPVPESPIVGRHPVEISRSPPQGQLHPSNPFSRGPPHNRPPRPAPEEYGVRPERRAGPPPSAVGAHPGGSGPPAHENSAPAARPGRPELDDTFSFPFQKKADSPPLHKPNFPFPDDGPLRPGPNTGLKDGPVGGPSITRPLPPLSATRTNGGGSPPASPRAVGGGGGGAWPLPPPAQLPVRTNTLDRDRPPQLNLAFQAGDYTQEIGDGPWTPPLPSPPRPARPDETTRPSPATTGGGGGFSFGTLTPIGPPPASGGGGGPGPIGVARGPSVRHDAAPDGGRETGGGGFDGQGQRRPDHGLVNPTGFSDNFGVTFI